MFLGHRKLKEKENKSQNKYVRLVQEGADSIIDPFEFLVPV